MMIEPIRLEVPLMQLGVSAKRVDYNETTAKTQNVALRRLGYLAIAGSALSMVLHLAEIVVWTGTPFFSLLFPSPRLWAGTFSPGRWDHCSQPRLFLRPPADRRFLP